MVSAQTNWPGASPARLNVAIIALWLFSAFPTVHLYGIGWPTGAAGATGAGVGTVSQLASSMALPSTKALRNFRISPNPQ